MIKKDKHGTCKKGAFKYYKRNRLLKHEIYCPEGVDSRDAETLACFRKWAWRFDMWFVSGTCGMTIGLGAVLGLIPVYVKLQHWSHPVRNRNQPCTERLTKVDTSVGDFADLVVGLLLIEYIKKRVNKSHIGEEIDEDAQKSFQSVLMRMRITLLIAAGVGVIPLFGDIFDTVYKANTRNVWILEQYMKEQARGTAMAMEMASAPPAQPMQSHHPKRGR